MNIKNLIKEVFKRYEKACKGEVTKQGVQALTDELYVFADLLEDYSKQIKAHVSAADIELSEGTPADAMILAVRALKMLDE